MKGVLYTFLIAAAAVSAQDVEPIPYNDSGVALEGYRALPKDAKGPVPAVVILHDWDGVNQYEQLRAVMIAEEFGWMGFAADIYGVDLHNVTDMDQRLALVGLYRGNSTLYTGRIQAAVELVATFPEVDADNIAIIGYCFGGTGVLTYALSGYSDVKAVVSFHGGLAMLPESGPQISPKVLVLSGGEDDTSTDIVDLEMTLNNATGNATWEITRYSGIKHAFTVFDNPNYNKWADMRSWDSMGGFLKEAIGQVPYEETGPPEMTNVKDVPYTDIDGTELLGYFSMPSAEWNGPYTTVVILPDWDGVNQYEKERATLLSELGYAAFAADIYGADLQSNLTMDMKLQYATKYRDNMTLFVQRIERAIEEVKTMSSVDVDNIAVIGYCLGGTGIIQLAFSGNTDVKAAVAFHGGLTTLPVPTTNITPYVLVLSGGDDDAHGNQTVLETALDDASADWEVTRYSGVVHGFTLWEYVDAYSLTADYRSWESMLTVFGDLLPVPAKSDDNVPMAPNKSPTTAKPPTSASLSITSYMSAMVITAGCIISVVVQFL